MVQVTEQDIMDWQLTANRFGHVACTQGGECLAGMVGALKQGLMESQETAVLDSTAHALKFSGFQEMYFENSFPPEFGVTPKPELQNRPVLVRPQDLEKVPARENPLKEKSLNGL